MGWVRHAVAWAGRLVLLWVVLLFLPGASPSAPKECGPFEEPPIPGTSKEAVILGRDLDGDCDPDEITINLEIIELQEEVYPGKFVSFWVFAPEGKGMVSPARMPSPTIRVEEGTHVKIHLRNPHYFPHTIHPHGTIHPNSMDGVPDFTQHAVRPGDSFTYEFTAKNPGTHWYHCHVQPQVHVLMGLAGMFIIEPNRPNNNFRHLIVGAGEIKDLARATREEGYQREYSLVYQDIDSRLNRLVEEYKDPRQIEKAMHREYDSTKRQPDIFLLNGRSFPYTLRDTLIRVKENERVKLRMLNAGERTISLHTHGHHPIITALDGYPVPEVARVSRDTFTIGPAQRIDLDLRTTPDSYYASGPGVWLMHDHTEHATTNQGINPGGDITVIAYERFIGPDGLPLVATSLKRFFDPDYYRGKVPVFDPSIFHSTFESYEKGWGDGEKPKGGSSHDGHQGDPPTPKHHSHEPGHEGARVPTRIHELEEHRPVTRSCAKPRGFRRIHMKGGIEFAGEGEVYGFEPKRIEVGRCEEVEVILDNKDAVRHALMIPGLNPMFMLEFRGPGVEAARFVTPDEDITLPFHCHVHTHEKMGMKGVFVVGQGGEPKAERVAAAGRTFEGVGKVILADPRKGELVLDHEEIPGFMAKMIMGYVVKPPTLLQGVEPGEKVRFTIDAERKAIVKLSPLTFQGQGTVILADPRKGELIVDHKEIPGLMAKMVMGYPVKPATLLQGLQPGDKIRFTIDAEQKTIVEITRIGK